MYIVAIAWLYVTILMAATEHTVLAGISTFVFYGLLPCGIVMYLMGAPGRRRAIKAREAAERESAAQGANPAVDTTTAEASPVNTAQAVASPTVTPASDDSHRL